MSLTSIVPVPRPTRTPLDPRDSDAGIEIVRFIEKFGFNVSADQRCYTTIREALLLAAHETARDAETARALARGARLCPNCGNYPDAS